MRFQLGACAISGSAQRAVSTDGSEGPPVREVADLFDRHGQAIYNLAFTITGSRPAASSATLAAMLKACAQTSSGGDAGVSTQLRVLARLTYQSCVWPEEPAPQADGQDTQQVSRLDACLATLDQPQRAALGLTMYGGLDCGEVALLMGLPPPVAAELLRSALRRCAQALRPRWDPA